MKKVYEKPQIYMERFELSQNIASCYYVLDYTDVNSCQAYDYDFDKNVFSQGCQNPPPQGYCWEPGTNGSTFNS